MFLKILKIKEKLHFLKLNLEIFQILKVLSKIKKICNFLGFNSSNDSNKNNGLGFSISDFSKNKIQTNSNNALHQDLNFSNSEIKKTNPFIELFWKNEFEKKLDIKEIEEKLKLEIIDNFI